MYPFTATVRLGHLGVIVMNERRIRIKSTIVKDQIGLQRRLDEIFHSNALHHTSFQELLMHTAVDMGIECNECNVMKLKEPPVGRLPPGTISSPLISEVTSVDDP